jgi:hypothetical protein
LQYNIKTVSDEMLIAIREKLKLKHIEDDDGTFYLKNLLAFLKCANSQSKLFKNTSYLCKY